MATTITPRTAPRERKDWLATLCELVDQVESWARARKWAVERSTRQIEESRLGTYSAPVLDILTPSGRVQLEPVARDIAKGEGRVDLVAWPSLTRMLLIRSRGAWKLKTDSGVDWPEEWSQRTFERLVVRLSSAG